MEYCKNGKNYFYAFDIFNKNGEREIALEKQIRLMSKKEELVCPECGDPVILKAGDINIPHYAHKNSKINCFYTTYIPNNKRKTALKILYNYLKKENKDIKNSLTFNHKVTDETRIDICIEKSKNDSEHSINENGFIAYIIRNTLGDLEEWSSKQKTLEYNGYFFRCCLYGTSKEIKGMKKDIDKIFYNRLLLSLGYITIINTETEDIETISAKFFFDDKNLIKKREFKCTKGIIDIKKSRLSSNHIYNFTFNSDKIKLDNNILEDYSLRKAIPLEFFKFLLTDSGMIYFILPKWNTVDILENNNKNISEWQEMKNIKKIWQFLYLLITIYILILILK